MNKEYDDLCQGAQKEVGPLMKKAKEALEKRAHIKEFYSPKTHDFLMKCPIKIVPSWGNKAWPGKFTKCTGYDETLHFGYAVAQGKIFRASFFAIEQIIDGEVCSRTFALDPVDHMNGLTPEYYFGVPVKEQDFNELITSHRNPLENFVLRQSEEELQLAIIDIANELSLTNILMGVV